MRASEIREMTVEEMRRKETDLKQELFNLRFQHEIGQLENPRRLKQIQKDIARVKTVIREVALKPNTETEKE
jgi:large subunit ribosomal protein L29